MSTEPPAAAAAPPAEPASTRPAFGWEVVLVLWVSLGASALSALLRFVERVTSGTPLSQQQTRIVAPVTPDRPWLDLVYQLSFVALPLGAVALAAYLLHRSGESLQTIGCDVSQPSRDLARGALLAVVVGGSGLALYLLAYQLGVSVQIAAAQVAGHWWDWPVLLLQAAGNAVVEEVVILGFVLHRLWQRGMPAGRAIVLAAALRGAYHLYQGVGGFVGNLAMGLLFGWLFRRWQRVAPMIVAHFLIDAVAFVGYAALADRVSWLP